MRGLNRFLKKLNIVLILFLQTLFLTSCVGGRELNTLGIVIATGIDIEDGKIIVTNEVVNPASGAASKNSSTQEKTLFVQGEGDTISEAILNTTLTFDRQLYYPHNHTFIFGEEIVSSGIGDYIDIFSRSNEQREAAYMLIAKGEKAYNVMGINSGMSQSPGRYINELIKHDMFNEEGRGLTIYEFFRYYYRQKEDYVIGVLTVKEKPEIDKSKPEATFEVLCVQGGAAFKADKLIGYYTGEEMMGFNFIVNELTNALIPFETPDYLVDKSRVIADRGKLSSVQIFRSKTKKEVKLIDGKLHLFVDILFRGSLKENIQGLDISNTEVINAMEKACAEKAKTYIENTLIKAQKEFNADTFGIGELVHRKYPKLWKEIKGDWDEKFRDLDFTVNVTTHINDTGFTNTPPNIMKGK